MIQYGAETKVIKSFQIVTIYHAVSSNVLCRRAAQSYIPSQLRLQASLQLGLDCRLHALFANPVAQRSEPLVPTDNNEIPMLKPPRWILLEPLSRRRAHGDERSRRQRRALAELRDRLKDLPEVLTRAPLLHRLSIHLRLQSHIFRIGDEGGVHQNGADGERPVEGFA